MVREIEQVEGGEAGFQEKKVWRRMIGAVNEIERAKNKA